MNSPNPINSTDKIIKSTNHLFYPTVVSSLLALMACTMLTPKTKTHAANYTHPHQHSTDQTANDPDPGYDWFY